MFALIILFAAASVSVCQDLEPAIPVLPSTPGVVLGNGQRHAQVEVEVFVELLCPASRDAWGVLKQLADRYNEQPEDVVIVIQQLVLPYHRNAYTATEGYNLVLDVAPARIVDYSDALFANLEELSTGATRDLSDNEVRDRIAVIAEEATGIEAEYFRDNVYSYDGVCRAQWKYDVRRGAAGTPWFFINGVEITSGDFTFETLSAYIDNLLASARKQ